jgi:hypothetical protein
VDAVKGTIEVTKKDLAKSDEARLLQGAVTHDGVEVQLVAVSQLFSTVMQGRERRQRQA